MKIQRDFHNIELARRIESMGETELAQLLLKSSPQNYPKNHGEDDNWDQSSLQELSKEWDNEADSIYDNWRERYHVSKG